MADLADAIATNAASPQSASVDGQSVVSQQISSLVLADQYLAARAAAGLRRRGIYFSKLVLPGALSDCGRAHGLGGGPW